MKKKTPQSDSAEKKGASYRAAAAYHASRGESSKDSAPRRRIVEAALRLFYRRGYANTSVDQILVEADAYKKSFYRYFSSREELGHEYLQEQSRFFFGFLRDIQERNRDFDSFLRAWMRVLRKDVRDGLFTHCPFAAFAEQTTMLNAEEGSAFRTVLRQIVERRRRELSEYLANCTFGGRKPSSNFAPRELADRIVALYQGAVALLNMSGDDSCIRRLEKDIKFIVEATLDE